MVPCTPGHTDLRPVRPGVTSIQGLWPCADLRPAGHVGLFLALCRPAACWSCRLVSGIVQTCGLLHAPFAYWYRVTVCLLLMSLYTCFGVVFSHKQFSTDYIVIAPRLLKLVGLVRQVVDKFHELSVDGLVLADGLREGHVDDSLVIVANHDIALAFHQSIDGCSAHA